MLDLAGNGWKWLEWLKIGWTVWKGLEMGKMAINAWKWLDWLWYWLQSGNYCKWLELAVNG